MYPSQKALRINLSVEWLVQKNIESIAYDKIVSYFDNVDNRFVKNMFKLINIRPTFTMPCP